MATRREKLLQKAKNSRHNLRFSDLVQLAESYGFIHNRTAGSHEMYAHPALPDHLNLQPLKNGKAKPYQVDQMLKAIARLSELDQE